MNKTVLIDFKGVIADEEGREIPGALDGLADLSARGWSVEILVGRDRVADVELWLATQGLMFPVVAGGDYEFHVSPNGYRFKSWKEVLRVWKLR